jgi:hypothetical protein
MSKKTLGIVTAITCCFASLFALTGCDALGITVTERGIQANSNVLLLCTIGLIILIVVVQRLLER